MDLAQINHSYTFMEFDTKVKLIEHGSISVPSEKDLDAFCEGLWPFIGKKAKNKADDGRGRIWMDYSTTLTTRYIVADIIEESKTDEVYSYSVRIYSARKPSYIADAIFALLAMFAMWCISKIFVPDPPTTWITALVASGAVGGFLAAAISQPFVPKE